MMSNLINIQTITSISLIFLSDVKTEVPGPTYIKRKYLDRLLLMYLLQVQLFIVRDELLLRKYKSRA